MSDDHPETGAPTAAAEAPTELYDAGYFAHHCSPDHPYERTEPWLQFFGRAADRIASEIAPGTTLDVGCAHGFLVEALRDRGIDAKGFDVSEFAISQVRDDVRPHVWVGSALDPIPGRYDLVTCIEVLEHLEEREADTAVANLCSVTDDVVFTSTPDDYREETHVNVRPLDYWTGLFARHGFVRDLEFDGGYLTWWAARYRRRRDGWPSVVADYERQVWRLKEEAHNRNVVLLEKMREVERLNGGTSAREETVAPAQGAPVAPAPTASEVSEDRLRSAELVGTLAATQAALSAEQAARRDADREWWSRLQRAERRASEVLAGAVTSRTADVVTELTALVDSAARALTEASAARALTEASAARALTEASAARALTEASDNQPRVSRLRQSIRRRTPLRLRRLVIRTVRVTWWTVSFQLPQRLRERRERILVLQPAAPALSPAGSLAAAEPADVRMAIRQRFVSLEPLLTFPVPAARPRVSIVTDSIGEGSLYGGVGTALIIAALLAERLGGDLRLVTRTERPDVSRLATVLKASGLPVPTDVDAIHAAPFSDDGVAVSPRDIFLTTSWWTTRATLSSVPTRQIIQLLQEDERMFYPRGDDRLRCSETLDTPDLHVLVNSELLFRHLTEAGEPVLNLAQRSQWFEPAFPEALFHDDPSARGEGGRRTFLFYARPGNLRNLYWRGVEAIGMAIEEGVLDRDGWRVIFVGRDLEPVRLPGGVSPELLVNLPWPRYAEVVRSVDLGLSLMDTPHASYPPLDLAASGAVVVTNICGLKTSLTRYSANILTVGPRADDLCRGLARGAALMRDEPRRAANYAASRIARDWRATLELALDRCVHWIGESR
jgi:hypothetical protein